jgi:hypothetical protein
MNVCYFSRSLSHRYTEKMDTTGDSTNHDDYSDTGMPALVTLGDDMATAGEGEERVHHAVERDDATSLRTLLDKYVLVASLKDSEYQKQRMADVITEINGIAAELEASFRAHPKGGVVEQLVVCWFHAPIARWSAQTYATFFTAFICTFFNPHCVLPATLRRLAEEAAIGTANNNSSGDSLRPREPTADEVREIQLLFGRLLKFLHQENRVLGDYFDPIVAYFYPRAKHWATCGLFALYERVISIWSRCLADIDTKGNSKDEAVKQQLQECMIKRDVTLLASGLMQTLGTEHQKRQQRFPQTLALALMQYYQARLETTKAAVMSKMMDEKESREEVVARKERELQAYEQDSLGAQMERATMQAEAEVEKTGAYDSVTVDATSTVV